MPPPLAILAAAALAAATSSAPPAAAQVSLERLDEVMDTRDDEMAAFRTRLNDPDPSRALAAMQVLIAEGSPAQRQLAIEHGFASTDPDIRLEAVRAILDSRPTLIFRWVPVEDEVQLNYSAHVRNFDGDIEAGNVARIPLEIGSYSSEEECWTHASSSNCLARSNAGELSFNFAGSWSQFRLDPAGRLVGRPNIGGTRVDAIADLTR